MSSGRTSLATSADALVGDSIEAAVRAKHRWRLRRLGRAAALAPPHDGLWAAGDPPPRPGCELEVLIDGADLFPSLAAAIEHAQESVYVTGWHLAPHFDLVRSEGSGTVGTLLAEAAERIRAEVREGAARLVRGTRIRCELDPREHPFHCHHEKTLVIDGRLAFVGGIDITDFGGDRYDTRDHPARRQLGWHDVGAQLRGPAVRDVHDHFALRWSELTGERLERPDAPDPCGDQTVQVVRTISDGMYDAVPAGEFRILESYVRALRAAERFVYLENQFLWSPEIVAILADKLREAPCEEFRIVILLPSRANNGQDDTQGQLAVLADADDGAGRMLAATIRSRSGARDDRLYVHAKVGIVDDRWLTIGSANLNAHSLFNDTEMNVVTDDPMLARDTRLRLWAEHLEVEPGALADEDPVRSIDERWQPIAAEQLERRNTGAPPTHRLLALPGISRRSRRLLGPLAGLIDDG
jgi:phosphatidylserine/phosphatidylglycerophosphate/cardiolipin synthase-like enzyme